MKWMCGAVAWLAFLMVVSGCAPDVSETVVVNKPVPENLCHTEIYHFPGCECPPYCVFPDSANPQIVVTYLYNPPYDADGNPFIIPSLTGHSYGGIAEPAPRRTDTGAFWDSTLAFTVEVDTNGHAAPSVVLHLAIDVADSAGAGPDSAFGHYHQSATIPKPKGTLFPDTVVMTDSITGKAMVIYSPSQYSEPITLTVSSPAFDSTLTKHWTVGVDSLVHMSGSYVTLVGETAPHPHSHYVRLSTRDALNTLAAKWNSVYHTNLELNDMSLPYGGKFDIHIAPHLFPFWRSDTAAVGHCWDHCEHRLGRSADINGLSRSDTVPYHNVVTWWREIDARMNEYPESGKAHLRDGRQP